MLGRSRKEMMKENAARTSELAPQLTGQEVPQAKPIQFDGEEVLEVTKALEGIGSPQGCFCSTRPTDS
jgi:hypothetical protein